MLLLLAVLLLLVLLLVRRVFLAPQGAQEPENRAEEYSGVLPLYSLQQVQGGWMAEPEPGWLAVQDHDGAMAACRELAARLPFAPSETLTILDGEGLPLVECPLELDLGLPYQ